jgi:hypothetical protein
MGRWFSAVKPWLPSLNSNKQKVGGIHVVRPRTKNKPGSAAGVIYIYIYIYILVYGKMGEGCEALAPNFKLKQTKGRWDTGEIYIRSIYILN